MMLLSLIGPFSFSGCVENLNGRLTENRTPEVTSTNKTFPKNNTDTNDTSIDLSLIATVVAQQSENNPPEFRSTLRNDSSKPVKIGYGQQLMFSAEGGKSPTEFRIVPSARDGEYINGCWVFKPEIVTSYPIRNVITLESGDSFGSNLFIYNAKSNSECNPPGTYHLKDVVYIIEDETNNEIEILLHIIIHIDDSGNISLDAKEPI